MFQHNLYLNKQKGIQANVNAANANAKAIANAVEKQQE